MYNVLYLDMPCRPIRMAALVTDDDVSLMKLVVYLKCCRFRVASSSDMPPDRKWMPGTAAGTPLSMVWVVQWATSLGVADGASNPVPPTYKDLI